MIPFMAYMALLALAIVFAGIYFMSFIARDSRRHLNSSSEDEKRRQEREDRKEERQFQLDKLKLAHELGIFKPVQIQQTPDALPYHQIEAMGHEISELKQMFSNGLQHTVHVVDRTGKQQPYALLSNGEQLKRSK